MCPTSKSFAHVIPEYDLFDAYGISVSNSILHNSLGSKSPTIKGAELFAGGGGLLLGTAKAGVSHVLAAEWDKWACQTLVQNANSGYPLTKGLRVFNGDVRDVKWSQYSNSVDLLTGGPPCQPFSLGGKARSAEDSRDMFPAMTDAIKQVRPRAFIVENVKGLTRKTFNSYYSYIKLRLAYPTLRSLKDESWTEHFARLQKLEKSGKSLPELTYRVSDNLVDAADYGVPQHRHRVFIVGFRNDVTDGWAFPKPTHSGTALKRSQITGEYFERHKILRRDRIIISRAGKGDPTLKPWRTVRDGLFGLPDPGEHGTPGWLDHKLQPGAKTYPGHTGSPIDEPSKALKAGGHGVPGGENMIRFPDGSVRYYSIREAARIQSFPDDYALHGSWGEAMRQIGNAVPVELAHVVAKSVVTHLERDSVTDFR